MNRRELPEKTRRELLDLQSDPGATARFHAALKALNSAGWSWPALGRAIGSSHEWARRLGARADGTDPGIIIPERRSTPSPVLHAPPEVLSELAGLLEEAVHAPDRGRTSHGLRIQVAALYAGLADALAAGWDHHGIGPALGMHPAAVTRFAAVHTRSGGTTSPAHFPAAPAPASGSRPRPADISIPDRDVRQLQRLRPEDGPLNANSDRDAALAYVRLLAYWYLRGASRAELSRASGQDWEAIRFRLKYWGYMGGTA